MLSPLAALVALSLCTGLVAAAARPCVENINGVWSFPDELEKVGACKVCSADGTRCEQCWEFFSMNAAGDCVSCDATKVPSGSTLTCLSCKGDDPSYCYDCGGRFLLREEEDDVEGYYADGNGNCIQCPTPGCTECQNVTGVCLQCQPGYGYVDGACQKCKQGDRVERTDGVTTIGPLCENCDGDINSCKRCLSGYFFDPAAAACMPCMAGCTRCESAEECSDCEFASFFLDPASGKCVQCPPNCNECSAANQCSRCESGYTNVTNDGSACAPCTDTMCSACPEGVDKCSGCSQSGYGPDPTTTRCVACTMPNCSNCGSSAAACTECGPGFLLEGATATCVPCKVQNCSGCRISSATGQEECAYCADGYMLSTNGNPTTCVPAAA